MTICPKRPSIGSLQPVSQLWSVRPSLHQVLLISLTSLNLLLRMSVFLVIIVVEHMFRECSKLGCLCKCMQNNSRLVAILFLCCSNLPRFDARIWPHFHMKICSHTSPLSSTHKLACQPHFLICD